MPRRKRERLTIDFLEKHAVLFGSKALGVAGVKSDIDFAMLEEHFNKLDMDDAELNPLTTYFPYIPSDGTGSIIYKYRVEGGLMIDLLILSTQEHLDIISKAVTEVVDNVPRYMLVNKPIRVECYQRALEHFGFVANDRVRPMASEDVWEPEELQTEFQRQQNLAQEIPIPIRTERTTYGEVVHRRLEEEPLHAAYDRVRRATHVEPTHHVLDAREMLLDRNALRARAWDHALASEITEIPTPPPPPPPRPIGHQYTGRAGRHQPIPNHRADMQVEIERQQEAMRRMAGSRSVIEDDVPWL